MKKFLPLIALMLTVECLTAHARPARKKLLPLMPPKTEAQATEMKRVPDSAPGYVYYGHSAPPKKKLIAIGMELGTFGRSNREADGFLGMEFLVGGRFFATLPLANSRWELRPSLGYFRRSDGEAQVSVTQNNFEFGLGALYLLNPRSNARVVVGLSNKVDMLQASIKAPGDTAESSPFSFRYRLGPMLGLEARVSSSTTIHLNTDFTVSISSPLRKHGGLSAGVSINMW